MSFADFTVPQYQRDDSYSASPTVIRVPSSISRWCRITPDEQAPGATGEQVRFIEAAPAASTGGRRGWGVCTERGMDRAGREEIPRLLDLHREIIAAG